MKKTLLLAGVASLFAANAQALELTPYVGADYNLNFVNRSHNNLTLNNFVPGKYHSGSINVGTKISPYFAVEAFGELSKHATKKFLGIIKSHTEYGAYGLDAFGILPLGCYGEWEVLGTAGIGRYRYEEKVGPKSVWTGHATLHEWGYRLGAGVQYNITENWGVRAMYRHIAFHNVKYHGEKIGLRGFDTFSVGVRYAF